MIVKKTALHSKIPFGLCLILLSGLIGCRTVAPSMKANRTSAQSVSGVGLDSLYRAISIRDSRAILNLAENGNDAVSAEAWRALNVTRINADSLYLAAMADGSYEAWFALSGHSLETGWLRNLEQRWLSEPDDRAGISLVLGLQGDQQSLEFLANNRSKVAGDEQEYPCALAINRLVLKYQNIISPDSLVQWALNSGKDDLFQAYLYAAYRSRKSIIPVRLDEILLKYWDDHPSMVTLSEQFLINIIAKNKDENLLPHLLKTDFNSAAPTLGVEAARALQYYPVDSSFAVYTQLLNNNNDNVVSETLGSLGSRDTLQARFDPILKNIVDNSYPTQPAIYVKALSLLVRNEPAQAAAESNHLHQMLAEDPYVADGVLALLSHTMTKDQYIRYLSDIVSNSDARVAMAAMFVIRQQWQQESSLERIRNVETFRTALRSAVERGDRGMTYVCAPLLQDSSLWKESDTALIRGTIRHFKFPDDIEAYEALAPVLIKRYGWWGKSLLDSLAAKQYPPFNKYLSHIGVKGIPAGNPLRYPLYTPNWQRLHQLGSAPIWTLETSKGKIVIELDPVRCPATVSAIDSLTVSGKYDGVPFHRVVPDFVIQGGDFERRDGFGDTSFVLPTEPSELEFTRGAVGMASAGNDTEGSQYFIMHQWAPHLNGHYTLFGEVIQGMNVVDRIVQGDKVLHASIETTGAE